MRADDIRAVTKITMEAQSVMVDAIAGALGMVIARLALHADVHEGLLADLRAVVRTIDAETPATPRSSSLTR